MRTRILLFLLTLILVPSLTYLVILFARGYRPNTTTGGITPTGLIAATSVPDGAQIIIQGELKSATNSTLDMAPGTYQVELKKEGYSSWTKTLEVQAGVVTKAAATLFPSVPSLKAITATGAAGPALDPTANQVAFIRNEGNLSNVYLIDLSESPLGSINRDAKVLTSLPKGDYVLNWSPDGKELLANATPSAYLATLDGQTTQVVTKTDWSQLQKTLDAPKLSTLPPILQDILASSAANLIWSPRENKILYTATASATIPDDLVRQLPGSNTQPQERTLTKGKDYVYDLEEDRNFAVGITIDKLSWFPDSGHLVKVEPNKVTIMEYDATNPTVVYAGPMVNGYAFPYPSGKQLLILTNLNPASISVPNLYAVSLR